MFCKFLASKKGCSLGEHQESTNNESQMRQKMRQEGCSERPLKGCTKLPCDLVRPIAAAATATASLLALSTPPDGLESMPGDTGPEAGVEMEPP